MCVHTPVVVIFQVSLKSVHGSLSHGGSKFDHCHYFGYWLLQQHHPSMYYDISRDTKLELSSFTCSCQWIFLKVKWLQHIGEVGKPIRRRDFTYQESFTSVNF